MMGDPGAILGRTLRQNGQTSTLRPIETGSRSKNEQTGPPLQPQWRPGRNAAQRVHRLVSVYGLPSIVHSVPST
jgi:2-hydroxychromene-2-carboxylate isomerase